MDLFYKGVTKRQKWKAEQKRKEMHKWTERVSDCCLMPTQWNDDEIRFVLDQHTIFKVLAHWNNSQRIDMSPRLDMLSRFQANHSLLFLLNAAYLAEKQHIPIL